MEEDDDMAIQNLAALCAAEAVKQGSNEPYGKDGHLLWGGDDEPLDGDWDALHELLRRQAPRQEGSICNRCDADITEALRAWYEDGGPAACSKCGLEVHPPSDQWHQDNGYEVPSLEEVVGEEKLWGLEDDFRAAYRTEIDRLIDDHGWIRDGRRCPACKTVVDPGDICEDCELCDECSPSFNLTTCVVCDSVPGEVLAIVSTREIWLYRWSEGRLSVVETGLEWKTVGRSIIKGERDRVRVELAADLPSLRKQARQTAALFSKAVDVRLRGGSGLCECGAITGVRCDWDGVGQLEHVAWVPEYRRDQAKTLDSRRGLYECLVMSAECAKELRDEWVESLDDPLKAAGC